MTFTMDHNHNVISTPHKRKLPEQECENDESEIPSLTWEEDDANDRESGLHFSRARTVSISQFPSPSKKRKIIGTMIPTSSAFVTPTIQTRFENQHEQPPPPVVSRSPMDFHRTAEDLPLLALPSLSDTEEEFVLSPRTSLLPRRMGPIPKRLFHTNGVDRTGCNTREERASAEDEPHADVINTAEGLFPSLRMRPSKRRFDRNEMQKELILPSLAEVPSPLAANRSGNKGDSYACAA
mmetsp:Transcript_23335/g.64748  ORF Transcript_23335/g.64748 Transcript_23335/m.64748 type:complete len:238 (-) Transcript_23335:2350-3063(-)